MPDLGNRIISMMRPFSHLLPVSFCCRTRQALWVVVSAVQAHKMSCERELTNEVVSDLDR